MSINISCFQKRYTLQRYTQKWTKYPKSGKYSEFRAYIYIYYNIYKYKTTLIHRSPISCNAVTRNVCGSSVSPV